MRFLILALISVFPTQAISGDLYEARLMVLYDTGRYIEQPVAETEGGVSRGECTVRLRNWRREFSAALQSGMDPFPRDYPDAAVEVLASCEKL